MIKASAQLNLLCNDDGSPIYLPAAASAASFSRCFLSSFSRFSFCRLDARDPPYEVSVLATSFTLTFAFFGRNNTSVILAS